MANLTEQEWFELVSRVADGEVSPQEASVPEFPDPVIQRNTTGAAGSAGLPEVWQFYLDARSGLETVRGRPPGSQDKMLDFGCGWGRITRLFMRDIPIENLYGIDVNPDLVAECESKFGNGNFSVNAPFPPTKFADNSFDLIVGFSVYSHLSEDACRTWMTEFARICAPDGIIALTTRGREFFDFCRAQRETAEPGSYPYALSMMFEDFDAAAAAYDRGEIVHSNAKGVTGGGALSGEFYGETFIPPAYAESAYSDVVRLVEWLPGSTGGRFHPVMLFTPKK